MAHALKVRIGYVRAYESKKLAIQKFLDENQPDKKKKIYPDIVLTEIITVYSDPPTCYLWVPHTPTAQKIEDALKILKLQDEIIPTPLGSQIRVHRFVTMRNAPETLKLLKTILNVEAI